MLNFFNFARKYLYGTMKKFFGRIAVVFGLGLVFGFCAQAQVTPITTYPYEANFGTTATSGEDNAKWCFKAFDGNSVNFDLVPSVQWDFATPTTDAGLAVRYKMNSTVSEDLPAAFTPVFRLEKTESVSYEIDVDYILPTGVEIPNKFLAVRLHSVNGDGEPFYIYDAKHEATDPINGENGQVNTFIGSHSSIPHTGSYSYKVSFDKIPSAGNYRFSFILLNRRTKNAPKLVDEVFYISKLTVKKIVGCDLAAGQIQTPYSDPRCNRLPFTAYVLNPGGGPVSNFAACYQIDNNEPIKQNFSQTIAPGAVRLISFTQKPDMAQGDHQVKFWVEVNGDINRNNDTTICLIRSGNQSIAGLPALFDFLEEDAYAWTMRSDSIYAHPAWHFEKSGTHKRPFIFTENQNARANNDYVISPPMTFHKDKMYRIVFNYAAVLESTDRIGDLSLALYVCANADWKTLLANKTPLWKKDRFADRGDRKVVVYYKATEDANKVLAFHTYGPSTVGGLKINSVSVSEAEVNTLDYFYDVDGNAGDDAKFLAERNLDFVDYDGNVSNEGKPGNWELCVQCAPSAGYNNSSNSIRSIGVGGRTDDWLVFKPFYLKAGKPYYFKFYAKMSMLNYEGNLEVLVSDEGPYYNLPFAEQPGSKRTKKISQNNYDTVRHVITVPQDGYYLISIRNVTNVQEMTDQEKQRLFTMYVDNFSLVEKEKTAMQILHAQVPYEARLGRSVLLDMTIFNPSYVGIEGSKINCCYQIDDGAVVRKHPGNISPQMKSTYTFQDRVTFTKNTQTVKFWVETEGSEAVPDTIRVVVEKIKARNLPFVEKFDEKSMEEWQSYPASRAAWRAYHGKETSRSGEWSVRCGGNNTNIDYLVTPMLRVEKGKTYRISFFYKRSGTGAEHDTLQLRYAKDRYDNQGFPKKIALITQPTATEYDFYHTYMRFPDADTGNVFIGLETKFGGNSPDLYIDDFIVVDSLEMHRTHYTLSDLVVSGNMSECDTISMGKVSFKITAGHFTVQKVIPAYVRYDAGQPKDVSLRKEMVDGEETTLSFKMPKFSGGKHTVTAWIGLPDESDRTDDTVKISFNVQAPATLPFKDANIHLVGQPQMSHCFELDSAGKYELRYRYNANNAVGASLRVHMLQYAQNSIKTVIPSDTVSLSGIKDVKKNLNVSTIGVYAIGFEVRDIPVGGSLEIDSVWFEKLRAVIDTVKPRDTIRDTSAISVFAPNEIRMQPNPARDFVDVELPACAQYLAVLDMQGRIRREYQTKGRRKINIPLQNLAPGVYILRIEGDNKVGTLKLIKQ